MRQITKVGIVLIGLITGLCLWWAVTEGPLRSPQDALNDFYAVSDRAEDQLMDPLILNGRRVVPYIIQEIRNKDMKLRRYAIGFLGNGRYIEAIPVLEQILADESEIWYFRSDALESIYQIAPIRARELAAKHIDGPELLGRVSREITSGQHPVYWSRTYLQAFLHVHE